MRSSRTFWLLTAILAVELVATILLLAGVEWSAAATAVVLLVVAAAMLVYAFWGVLALVRNRFRFRLSTLLLLTTILAAGCGILTTHIVKVRKQSTAIQGLPPSAYDIRYADLPFPGALRKLGIESWFVRVSRIHMISPPSTTDKRVADVSAHLRLLPYKFQLDLFSNADLTNDGLKSLGAVEHLSGLRLGGVSPQGKPVSPQITDAGLEHLAALKISDLDFTGTGITCDGLAKLRNPKSLRCLKLGYTNIATSGAEVLATFDGLESLSLDNTRISDEALVHIGKLTQLQSLSLAATDITDAGLAHLTHLRNLRFLGLGLLPLSEKAVRNLKAALPECKVDR